LEIIDLTFSFAKETDMKREIGFWQKVDTLLSDRLRFSGLLAVVVRLRLYDFDSSRQFRRSFNLELLFPVLSKARQFIVLWRDVKDFHGKIM
jgi:hypothetical protein